MDYGAIISLAGSAAKGIGSAQAASAQKDALTWDPVLYKPGKIGDAQQEFLQQGEKLGAVDELLGKANRADNKAVQERLFASDPSLAAGISATDQNALDYSRGVIAPDVQRDIDRKAAERALQGGYAGSDMAGAQNLVDTMRYRLNEQTTMAPEMQAKAFNYANALNPTETNSAETLMSVPALNERRNQLLMYNNQIANQQAQLNEKAKAESGNIFFGTNVGGDSGGGMGGMPSI